MRLFRKPETRALGEYIKIFGPAMLLTLAGFVVAYQFVDPAPPDHIVIGTGSESGAYYKFGQAYREILKQNGVELEVRLTAGSVENIRLLEAKSGGVEVAFVQGGTGALAQSDDIVSLGSLFFEPSWIFHRPDIAVSRLSDLQGLRVAVGAEGSGTRVLAMHLLGLNGITANNTQILPYGSQQAVDMLLNGDLDVAIFVATHRAPYILTLMDSKSVRLVGLERAEAYALRYHYLHVQKLPEGVIDFEANIPPRDMNLVAPATQLAARTDLHPALVDLLLQAATEVHGAGGGFEGEGEFPAPKYLDFPLSKEARQYYKSGTPFLQRYLPFWVANFLARMKVLLLPLLALMFPLFKLMPPLYRWRIRSRIYRWYSELEAVDPEKQKDQVEKRLDEYIAELDRIEDKVSRVSIPLAYSEELYDLRLHIDMLRNKLIRAGQKE
ncbi:MAG: TAXI family TRAP transporter solute-binding subunit [Deltaproteobacteria bacterium]|nr:MAG: TAXI family TRAP transporter solute-binding subunit [Deltaproteobacteria bacterium]